MSTRSYSENFVESITFGVREGLQENSISSMVIDSLGFVWVTSMNKLYRFDGYRFQQFNITNDKRDNNFKGISFNSGRIWSTTNGDFISFSAFRNNWIKHSINPLSGEINKHLWLSKSDIIFSVENSIIKSNINDSTNIFRDLSEEVNDFCISKNKIFVSSGKYLHILKEKNLKLIDKIYIGEEFKLFCNSKKTVFISKSDGVYFLDKFRLNILSSIPKPDRISEFNGGIVVSTSDFQLYNIKLNYLKDSIRNIQKIKLTDIPSVTDIIVDKDNLIWCATNRNGLYLIKKKKKLFDNYAIPRRYNTGNIEIIGVHEDSERNIFLVSSSEIYIYENKKIKNIEVPNNDDITIKSTYSHNNQLFLSTNKGVWTLRNKKLTSIEKTYNLDVTSFLILKNGTRVITTGDNEFIRTDSSYNVISRLVSGKMQADKLNFGRISSMLESNSGRLYLGTDNGLYEFQENTLSLIYIPHIYKNNKLSEIITSLKVCDDHNIWVSTQNSSLSKYNTETKKFINYRNLLAGSTQAVYTVITDKTGILWLTGDDRLLRFDSKSVRLSDYGTIEGLQKNRYLSNSGTLLKSGEIIIGGENGFTKFNPDKISPKDVQRNITITSFMVNNISQPVKKNYKLNHNKNDLIFDFSISDFRKIYKNNFYVIYNGRKSDLSKRHTIAYNNLNPGKHNFILGGFSSDGMEAIPFKMSVTILPPWWLSNWAYPVYILLFGTILFLIFRFYLQRVTLKNQLKISKIKREQSERMNDFKLKFFTNISHEIRTPVTLISGPVQNLSEILKDNKEATSQINILKNNTNRLLKLVDQLLDFRKLQHNKIPFITSTTDLNKLITEIVSAFRGAALEKNIVIDTEIPEKPIIGLFDADKIEKILFNLISNAIKFTDNKGKISIKLEDLESKCKIYVIDNGKGVDDHARIFERYESDGGFGIGLSLTKELVELHEGEIKYVPNSDGGSVFVVTLDVNKSADYFSGRENINTVITESTNEHKILIAEDNQELRDYLNNLFKGTYHTILAENGKVALMLAEKHNPDIIISDIMMPEIDGIKLCKTIKEDVNLSHTPIVLLTAYATNKHKYEGTEAGADLYITKPFDSTLLKAKINNILKNRQILISKISEQDKYSLSDLPINSIDKGFLNIVNKCIKDNIDNPELNVEMLSNSVNLSKSQLTRKMNSMAGVSPAKYIQDFRLNIAYKLLKESELSVSEIAYQTGFSDPKYFSRNFKSKFGNNPSKIRE